MIEDNSIDFNSSGYSDLLLSIFKIYNIFVSKNQKQRDVFYLEKIIII